MIEPRSMLALVLLVSSATDDVDDPSTVVLGPTMAMARDGSVTRLSEQDALSMPWRCTAGSITIGSIEACALEWPMAIPSRGIGQALWLVDGQCLVGGPDPDAVGVAAGTIRWRAGSTVRDLPLSEVRAWTAAMAPVPSGVVDADRVILRNGDVLEGLVTTLGRTVEIEVGGELRGIDGELVSSVQFVEVGERPVRPAAVRVWIDDGTILDVASVERDGALVRMALPATPSVASPVVRVRIDQLLGVATPALSLAGLSMRGAGPSIGPVPGMEPSIDLQGPGRLGSMDATLLGPGMWSMPIEGAGVLVGQVRVPDRVRAIADHALVVRQAGVELSRIEVRSDARSLRVPVKPGVVEFELVPGKAGPVGCMVELVDLVQVSAAP